MCCQSLRKCHSEHLLFFFCIRERYTIYKGKEDSNLFFTKKLTISETQFHIISWRFMCTLQIKSVHLDIVPIMLIPTDELFGSFGTIAWVSFAPDWRIGFCEGDVADRVGDFAFESCHVHVRFSASYYKKRG